MTQTPVITRIPRNLGLTYLSIQYRKELNEDKRTKLYERMLTIVIEQYVANGFNHNGKPTTFTEMAGFLGIETNTLMRLMNKSFERVANIFDNGEGAKFARVGFLKAFNWALETAESHKAQTLLLKAEQGQKFVPFLTSELNKALANQAASIKPVIDLLKIMMDKTQENPLIPQSSTTNTQNIYVTATDAAKLIETRGNQSMLTNNDLIDAELGDELGQFPEVGAKYQDLTSIGLKHKGLPKGNDNLVE